MAKKQKQVALQGVRRGTLTLEEGLELAGVMGQDDLAEYMLQESRVSNVVTVGHRIPRARQTGLFFNAGLAPDTPAHVRKGLADIHRSRAAHLNSPAGPDRTDILPLGALLGASDIMRAQRAQLIAPGGRGEVRILPGAENPAILEGGVAVMYQWHNGETLVPVAAFGEGPNGLTPYTPEDVPAAHKYVQRMGQLALDAEVSERVILDLQNGVWPLQY